jgi:hypothetical protein
MRVSERPSCSSQQPHLTTPDEIVKAAKSAGLKEKAATFFQSQLNNCNKKNKG